MWVNLMMMVKLLMMVVVLMVIFSNMGMNLMGVAFVSLKSMQLSVGPQMVGVWELAGWAVISFGMGTVLADMNMGMLYLFAVSSLGAYAVLCSGWASNSRSSFLGTLSADGKFVSGFHTEYSAVFFVLFFLNEYGHVILMSYFNVLLFSGGWLPIITLASFTWIPEVVWLLIRGAHGSNLLSMFMPQGAPMALVPLLVMIELVSDSASAISLDVRLADNISAGHLLLVTLNGFTWTMLIIFSSFTWTMLAAEGILSLANVIQAYAFTLLTYIYINSITIFILLL